VTPFKKKIHEKAPSNKKYYSNFKKKKLSFYKNIQFFEKKKKTTHSPGIIERIF